MVLCKNCGHELDLQLVNGRLIISHKHERDHEGDGGSYWYCTENIIDCETCKAKGRLVICGCNKPEIWMRKEG